MKEVQLDDSNMQDFFNTDGEIFQAELCTAGIPREPWDFVAQAAKVGHPRSMALHLNQEVIEMLKENFSLSSCDCQVGGKVFSPLVKTLQRLGEGRNDAACQFRASLASSAAREEIVALQRDA